MGALPIDNRRYTIEEWQALERETGEKYEFHDGKLFSVTAMSGVTALHAMIGGNVVFALKDRTRQAPGEVRSCGVYTSELQVMVRTNTKYVYPDAAVICGRAQFDTRVRTAARNSIVVAEVMSPGSADYDLGPKHHCYASLETLRDYIIVSQDKIWVEVRSRRRKGGAWEITLYEDREASIKVPSLSLSFDTKDIYDLVDFSPTTA